MTTSGGGGAEKGDQTLRVGGSWLQVGDANTPGNVNVKACLRRGFRGAGLEFGPERDSQ